MISADFVASLEPDADIRLRLHDPDRQRVITAGGLTIGTPEVLGAPGGIESELGTRRVQISIAVYSDEFSARRFQSDLARELRRPDNYLRLQLSPSAGAQWLHTYQTSIGEIDLNYTNQDVWLITVQLDADALFIGEPITETVVIPNDPAVNGVQVRLPEIVGDDATPLVIDIEAGTTDYIRPFLSLASVDQAWSGPVFWQAESWTLGAATTVTSDSLASNGSRAEVSINTNGTAPTRRLTGSVTVPFAGQWRLFARMAWFASVGSPASKFVTVTGTGAAVATSLSTTVNDHGTGYQMIELGTYVFPKGNMPSRRPYTLAPAEVGIDIGNDDFGSGYTMRVYVDYVIAVPVDLPLDRAAFVNTLDFQSSTQTTGTALLRLDGENEAVQLLTSGSFGVASPETPPGAFLHAVPGAANVITVMPRRYRSGSTLLYSDVIATNTTLTVTYRPRWLYVAGV